MKLALLLLVALAAGALIYPRHAEHTETVCAAFEHKLASAAAVQAAPRERAGLRQFLDSALAGSQGRIVAAYLGQRYPQLPAFIGCAIGYWRVTFDPDLSPLLTDAVRNGR